MLFAFSDSSSVEIEGTSKDLGDLSRKIKECEDVCSIALAVPTSFDDRGLRYLTEIVVRIASHAVEVSELDQKLIISGAREKLGLLSQNIDSLVESQTEGPSQKGEHIHVEFYSGHFFLCSDALPLVFTRQYER
jgi:hypothetical protein